MTDKEMVEEYLKDESKYLIEDNEGNLISITKKVKEAFIVGLKAGRPKWHDLRKDKKDLPDNSCYVWTNVGPGYHDDDGWWDDYGRLQDVIAWCEPKFEE